MIIDRENLDRFIKILNKINWLKTLANYASEGNVVKVELIKECVSDLDSIITAMYKDLVVNPMTTTEEIKELADVMLNCVSDKQFREYEQKVKNKR